VEGVVVVIEAKKEEEEENMLSLAERRDVYLYHGLHSDKAL
jgi:hypothetical protein